MPLMVRAGLNRKIGEPNYGSRGANVSFEVELDSSIIDDPQRLRSQVRQLFHLAKQAVEEELAASDPCGPTSPPPPGADCPGAPPPRLATPSQLRTLEKMAEERGLELPQEVLARYGVQQVRDLTHSEASHLIRALKQAGVGSAVA